MGSDVMCPGCWAQGVSTLSRPGAPWTLILGTQNHTGCLHTSSSEVSCTHWSLYPHVGISHWQFQASQKIARVSPYLLSSSNIKVEKGLVPAVTWVCSIPSCPGWDARLAVPWDTLKLQEHPPCMDRPWVQHTFQVWYPLCTRAEWISVEATQGRNDGDMRYLYSTQPLRCETGSVYTLINSSGPSWRVGCTCRSITVQGEGNFRLLYTVNQWILRLSSFSVSYECTIYWEFAYLSVCVCVV